MDNGGVWGMIYPAGRYNLNFDIAAIIICVCLLLHLLIAENLRVRRTRSYFWVVLSMLLCSSGELAMDIVRNAGGAGFSNLFAEAATLVSHVAHNSTPFLLLVYFLSLTGLWHGLKRRDAVIIGIPEAVLVLSHVITPVRHLIYYYYGACQYVRGPLYAIYYVVVAFYVIYGVTLLFLRRSSIERRSAHLMVLLCCGYLFGMLVGMVDTYVRMTNFIQVLVLCSAFLLLENESVMLDRATGVYNARAFDRDSFPLFHFSGTTYVLSIKLQDVNNYRLMLGMDSMQEVMRQMGAWMLGIAGEDCCFYRLGTGEFAVLLFRAGKAEAEATAERVRVRFAKPWAYSSDGASVSIPAQVWASSIPDRISAKEQLLAFSEATFNASLPQGHIYVADEARDEKRRVEVDIAIRRAIASNGFEVFYQPIYDASRGRVRSCEALVRMTDPELGPVSPEEFIKVAERSGTISTIGMTVFEKVCQFLAEGSATRGGIDFVEVNLSPIQCMERDLVPRLKAAMDRYGVRAEQIVLEITESAVIHNTAQVRDIIQDLRDAGFRFALDDFGTGQANYSYVREFPFSIIKIDKSFLWAADDNKTDRAILRNMLSLVKDLGLECVVEGVETECQRDALVRDGVKYLQGYLYSKPVPPEQFLAYVKRFNGR